jgi:hypothetical protein
MAQQDANRVDKPFLATHGVGRAPYGLLSFGYSYLENVTKRMLRQMAGKGGLTKAQRAKYAGNAASAVAAYIFVSVLTSLLYSVMNDKDEDREKKLNAFVNMMTGQWDEDVMDLMQNGISRTGLFGPLDPAVQFVYGQVRGTRNARYEVTIPKLIFGPQIGGWVDDLARVGNVLSPMNSPKNTTAEFNAGRGLYNMVMGMVTVGVLGLIKWQPGLGLLLNNPWFGTPQITNAQTRDSVLEAISGAERPKVKDKKKDDGFGFERDNDSFKFDSGFK